LADGDGQCHGLCLDRLVERLHRLLLPQADGRAARAGRRAVSTINPGERPWQRALLRLGVLAAVVAICLPGLWVMLTAFRANVEAMTRPPVWIPSLTLDNFRAMLGLLPNVQLGLPIGHYFRNSMIASVTSTVVALAIGMMGGYAFARFRFR